MPGRASTALIHRRTQRSMARPTVAAVNEATVEGVRSKSR